MRGLPPIQKMNPDAPAEWLVAGWVASQVLWWALCRAAYLAGYLAWLAVCSAVYPAGSRDSPAKWKVHLADFRD